MRRSAKSYESQSIPLRRRWMFLVVVLVIAGSVVATLQPSWAQPHQNDLRATVPEPTPTYTPGPTSTPTQPAEPGVSRLLLRNESGGYQGTMDTTIDSYAPYVPSTLDGGLQLKGNEGKSILIRYDLQDLIPDGATILSAELVLYVDSPAGSTPRALDVSAYRVLRDWQADTVSWNRVNTTLAQSWESPGCNGVTMDREAVADDTVHWEHLQVYKGFDVAASIAYWLDNPQENFGWLIKGGSSSTGSFGVPSSRSSNLDQRPVLRIDYVTGGTTPTPTVTQTPSTAETPGITQTPTSTQTPSATPTPATMVLEAIADSYLDSWEPDAGHGDLGFVRVRPDGIRKPVIQFDLSALELAGYDTLIQNASLVLTTGSTAPSQPVEVLAHRLLVCWDEDAVTWNSPREGEAWQAPGASGQADAETVGAGPVTVSRANTTYSWDVTAAAQAMIDDENCGLILVAQPGGQAEATFLSSEAGYDRPQLVIDYAAIPQATPTPEGRQLVAIVYHDLDRDGFRDSGEDGIPGATIQLQDDSTGAVIESVETGADGQAQFSALLQTAYRVRELNAPGFVSTTVDEQRVQMLGPVNYVYFGDVAGSAVALPVVWK